MGEEWGIGGHVHNVGITLDARHVGCLVERGLEVVPLLSLAMAGVFAGKHLRTLAIIRVVAQTMTEEPLLVAIVVLVVEIHLQLLHTRLQQVEVPTFRIRTSGADQLQLRVFSADGIGEFLQALGKHRTVVAMGLVVVPLLITHSQELQSEGLGMAHLCTYLTPLGIHRTIGKLHKVEGILDITVQVVDCHVDTGLRGVRILELAGQSAGDHRQGLTTEVLAQLEELEEAETITLVVVGIETMTEGVVPAVLVQRTVLYWSYAVLPLIARLEVSTLDDTATGETEHTGMHVVECLSQIAAHAILTTLPGVGGEE